ncbi:hypothetical protein [Shimia sp. R9_3]|uniref:hypothetical protein n=1 Tax=Shimia sp. R9_3 TaxID=2821113 RepID=UPI001AD97BE6|nr:hypothetical protein [Shimia sp. R9_3]
MQGIIRGEGTPVEFNYEQGVDTDHYTAVVDGEKFSGKAVNASSSSGYAWDFDANSPTYFETSSGSFVATLFGDQGSTMRCQMNYADNSGFTALGGVGVCQHSDGKVIDVMW